jgi:predicted restriction endonuclease
LEAAHLIPVEKNGSLSDLRSGLLLCENHHSLFDSYAWTLDREYRVVVTTDPGFRTSAARNHVLAVENQRLPNLPDLTQNRPATEAISWRLDAFYENQR